MLRYFIDCFYNKWPGHCIKPFEWASWIADSLQTCMYFVVQQVVEAAQFCSPMLSRKCFGMFCPSCWASVCSSAAVWSSLHGHINYIRCWVESAEPALKRNRHEHAIIPAPVFRIWAPLGIILVFRGKEQSCCCHWEQRTEEADPEMAGWIQTSVYVDSQWWTAKAAELWWKAPLQIISCLKCNYSILNTKF